MQIDYGGECHISKRPYTKFRWRPGSDARYKSTIICQEVAKAKNVCQVCLLDLKHNLPVQVRDQLTNAVVEDIPESDVGLEYQLALKESRGELGAQYKDNDVPENDNLARLTRTTPYYKVWFVNALFHRFVLLMMSLVLSDFQWNEDSTTTTRFIH
jgi:pre-mRNA-splicing factor RBM22/SLT11